MLVECTRKSPWQANILVENLEVFASKYARTSWACLPRSVEDIAPCLRPVRPRPQMEWRFSKFCENVWLAASVQLRLLQLLELLGL